MFQIRGTAVNWKCKKQTCVALSSTEAEYRAQASCAQEAVWLKELTSTLKCQPTEAVTVFENNQSAICLAKNPQYHGRSKHINIKFHFIREQVTNGTVKLKYCPTELKLTDILTKGIYVWNGICFE